MGPAHWGPGQLKNYVLEPLQNYLSTLIHLHGRCIHRHTCHIAPLMPKAATIYTHSFPGTLCARRAGETGSPTH